MPASPTAVNGSKTAGKRSMGIEQLVVLSKQSSAGNPEK
jgi:hypothetical protein